MLTSRKVYLGTYKTQEEAGRVFDKYALAYRGLSVTIRCAHLIGWNK